MTVPSTARRSVRPALVVVALLGLAGGTVRAQPTLPAAPAPPTGDATATALLGEPIDVGADTPLGLIAPDSEVVYGPTLYGFDTAAFIAASGGYLAGYSELVDGEVLTGAEAVDRVAQSFSVGPRLLLALIELRSGWLQSSRPRELTYPLGGHVPGLYNGLVEAADALNDAYYGRRWADRDTVALSDGRTVRLGPELNAGSFAVMTVLSADVDSAQWPALAAPSRFWTTWTALFGDEPLNFNTSPIWPAEVPPLALRLPFSVGTSWYYVEGPHSSRGLGGPRAAVAFAPPPAGASGCAPSPEWAVAAADGAVVRSDAFGVVVDGDADGYAGSGWTLTYRHLAPEGRVVVGDSVTAGDTIGHPSCADGASTARVSLARRYNGEWVPADHAAAPLMMDGWVAVPGRQPGEGALIHSGAAARQAGAAKVDGVNNVIASPDGR